MKTLIIPLTVITHLFSGLKKSNIFKANILFHTAAILPTTEREYGTASSWHGINHLPPPTIVFCSHFLPWPFGSRYTQQNEFYLRFQWFPEKEQFEHVATGNPSLCVYFFLLNCNISAPTAKRPVPATKFKYVKRVHPSQEVKKSQKGKLGFVAALVRYQRTLFTAMRDVLIPSLQVSDNHSYQWELSNLKGWTPGKCYPSQMF